MYDRQLLLSGAKRNAVLDLHEVKRYGLDSYANADYVTIYGLRPEDWLCQGHSSPRTHGGRMHA
jgi:hypothetical protein